MKPSRPAPAGTDERRAARSGEILEPRPVHALAKVQAANQVAVRAHERPEETGRRYPSWLWNLVLDGLSKLLALRLEGAPPEDAVEGCALAWAEAICHECSYEEALDAERLAAAFRLLMRDADRWPAPKAYLARVKPREEPRERLTDKEIASGLAGIAMIREATAVADWLRARADRRMSVLDYMLMDVRAAIADRYEAHRLLWDGRHESRKRLRHPL